MIRRKGIGRATVLLLVLFLLCFCTAAEATSDKQTVVCYILIDNVSDETFNPQDTLPEILKGFSFLLPDQAEVSYQVYRIINTEYPFKAATQFEFLFRGFLRENNELQTFAENLKTIGKQPGDGARFTIADLAGEVAENAESRILYIGSLTQKKVDSLETNYVKKFPEIPYCIFNTNSSKALKSGANCKDVNLDDTVSAVKTMYEALAAPYYDQEITDYHTKENRIGFSLKEDGREIKVVAPVNTYDGTNPPDYTGTRLNLIVMEPGKTQYELDLEENGTEKTIVVSEVFQPFVFEEISTLQAGYTMKDTLEINGRIKIRDPEKTPYIFKAEDWSVSLQVGTENLQPITPEEDGSFAFTKELRSNEGGDYSVLLEARNNNASWMNITGYEVGTVKVSNNAPKIVGEETRKEITIWRNGPIPLSNETITELEPLFSDDGPKEDLTFSLNEGAPDWIWINDQKQLVIDDNLIDNSASVQVTATDKAKLSSSAYSFEVIYHNADKLLEGANAEILLTGKEGDDTFHRDSTVRAEVVLTLPEGATTYLDALDHRGAGAFVDALTGMLKLEDQEPIALALKAVEDNPLKYTDAKEYQQFWKSESDCYSFQFRVYLSGKEEPYAEADAKLEITDQIPVVLTEKVETPYKREAKGPWILYQDLPQEDREIKFSVADLLQTEIADIITINVSSEAGMKLTQTGEKEFCLTDEEIPEAEEVEGIIWNTKDESPVLRMWNSERKDWKVTLEIRDDKNNTAKGSPLEIVIFNRYHNENLMIMIAAGILALIVLLILIAVIHQIRKPKFTESVVMEVSCENYSSQIPLKSWGKKELSLLDLLRYSGVPLVGFLDGKKLSKVLLKAGRKDKKVVLSGTRKVGLSVRVDESIKDSNKIVMYQDTKVEIELQNQEQEQIRLTLVPQVE